MSMLPADTPTTCNSIVFLKYLLKHNKEVPIVIGPGGIVYITDHLARALYDVGVNTWKKITKSTVHADLQSSGPDAEFVKQHISSPIITELLHWNWNLKRHERAAACSASRGLLWVLVV
jgi:hypothetical protein